ncbi:MAG: hypothetical protein EBX41_03590 [Chitinophagia bacterium]|nr:hypothetical protein [Chitinophagia bacterium]
MYSHRQFPHYQYPHRAKRTRCRLCHAIHLSP